MTIHKEEEKDAIINSEANKLKLEKHQIFIL